MKTPQSHGLKCPPHKCQQARYRRRVKGRRWRGSSECFAGERLVTTHPTAVVWRLWSVKTLSRDGSEGRSVCAARRGEARVRIRVRVRSGSKVAKCHRRTPGRDEGGAAPAWVKPFPSRRTRPAPIAPARRHHGAVDGSKVAQVQRGHLMEKLGYVGACTDWPLPFPC